MTAHLALLSGMNHAMASIACPGVGGGGEKVCGQHLDNCIFSFY